MSFLTLVIGLLSSVFLFAFYKIFFFWDKIHSLTIIRRAHVQVYFPIVLCIIISIILSLLLTFLLNL